MRREKIQINDDVFDVEVAETEKERAQGLMHRRHLPVGRGMFFVMDGGPASFHMKNTHVPLDILFFDAQGRAVKIDSMAPHIGHSRCNKDVRYVLELPAGTCQQCGIIAKISHPLHPHERKHRERARGSKAKTYSDRVRAGGRAGT